MNFLKGMALGLLGFLLFVELPLLGLSLALNRTLLNPRFVVNEIGKLDITALARNYLDDQTDADFKIYANALNATLAEQQPWVDQEINDVVYAAYDYLQGRADKLDIVVTTAALKTSLVNHYTIAWLEFPPPAYFQASAAQKAQILADAQKSFSALIPASISIDESVLGPENMQSLNQARRLFGLFHSLYIWSFVLAVLFILLIVLVLRRLKGISRTLGLIFALSGALGYIVFFILKGVSSSLLPTSDLPAQVQTWLPQFINDILSPLGIFNLIILVIGIILLVVSFVVPAKSAGAAA